MTNPTQYPNPNQEVANYHPQPQPYGYTQQSQPQPYGYPQQAQPHVSVNVVNGGAHGPQDILCCGIGVGWVLFILGFFFTIPWYVGLFMLFCLTDPREKPGCIACAIASLVATIIIVLFGVMSAQY